MLERSQPTPDAGWPAADLRVRRQAEAQLVYRTPLLEIGRFRARPDEPLFRHSGPPGQHVVAFPHCPVRIRHEGRAPFVTDASLVTFYNPDEIYFREAVSPQGDACDWISLRPDVVAEVARATDGGEGGAPAAFCHPVGPCDARSFAVQRSLMAAIRPGRTPDALLMEETAVRLLERLLRAASGAPRRVPAPVGAAARAHRDLAESARARLALRFAHDDSLLDLATSLGCSVAHLCRVFREHAGTSLHEHRNQLRLRRAVDRIREPGLRLVDLAIELGFSSHSHMTASFRRLFGVAPQRMRRVSLRALSRLLDAPPAAQRPGAGD